VLISRWQNSQLTYRVNTIPIRIPAGNFLDWHADSKIHGDLMRPRKDKTITKEEKVLQLTFSN
jgi:hypothetical protein